MSKQTWFVYFWHYRANLLRILEKPQFQMRRVEQSRKALLLIDSGAIWRLAADFGRAPCSSPNVSSSSPDESRAAPLYQESNSFANLQVSSIYGLA